MAIIKEEVEGLLEHITVTRMISDGKLIGYELRPHEGYVMLLKSLTVDDEGNPIPEEEYKYSIYAITPASCNLQEEFKAVELKEGMEILGTVDKPEIM